MAKGDFTVNIVGLDRFTGDLVALGMAAKPILKDAMKAGGKIIQVDAQANVKDGPGTEHPKGMLRRSIKTRTSSRNSLVRVTVGTSSKSNLYVGKTFYGGFREYGHKIGSRKLGAARRDVPPHPFMSKAVKDKGNQAGALVIQMVQDGLAKAAKP